MISMLPALDFKGLVVKSLFQGSTVRTVKSCFHACQGDISLVTGWMPNQNDSSGIWQENTQNQVHLGWTSLQHLSIVSGHVRTQHTVLTQALATQTTREYTTSTWTHSIFDISGMDLILYLEIPTEWDLKMFQQSSRTRPEGPKAETTSCKHLEPHSTYCIFIL